MKIDTDNPTYSFVSLTLKIDTDEYTPKSLKYGDGVERGEVRGNHPVMLGFTRGEYKADGLSVELFMADYLALQKKLGAKFTTQTFSCTATYAEGDGETITDTMVGCKFKKREADQSQGNDALTRIGASSVTVFAAEAVQPFLSVIVTK